MNTSYALSWLTERERQVLELMERGDVDRGENRNASNRELNLRCERILTASKRGERELTDVMKTMMQPMPTTRLAVDVLVSRLDLVVSCLHCENGNAMMMPSS